MVCAQRGWSAGCLIHGSAVRQPVGHFPLIGNEAFSGKFSSFYNTLKRVRPCITESIVCLQNELEQIIRDSS